MKLTLIVNQSLAIIRKSFAIIQKILSSFLFSAGRAAILGIVDGKKDKMLSIHWFTLGRGGASR